MPYSVFDAPRVLQTALQSLHDAAALGPAIGGRAKSLILGAFTCRSRDESRREGACFGERSK